MCLHSINMQIRHASVIKQLIKSMYVYYLNKLISACFFYNILSKIGNLNYSSVSTN